MSALSESAVSRWMPWPITTRVTHTNRALSQNGTRSFWVAFGRVVIAGSDITLTIRARA